MAGKWIDISVTVKSGMAHWPDNPEIVVGKQSYPMRPTSLMTNRWEGLVPVPSGTSAVHYRYKFDFNYNAFGKPKTDSALSPEYTLRVTEQ